MLFSSAVQPSTISLFSSTGSDPLSLFVLSTDKSLPSDSYIHLYHDQFSEPLAPSPASLLHLPEQGDDPSHGYELDQTVLHIQSPTIRTTYIQCPTFEVRARDSTSSLGIKLPWMHLHVRNLGLLKSGLWIMRDVSESSGWLHFRATSPELAVKLEISRPGYDTPCHLTLDQRKVSGEDDWSSLKPRSNFFTFSILSIELSQCQAGQIARLLHGDIRKRPRLKLSHKKPGSPPLLLLPLSFPSPSSHPLTPWNTINLHLPALLPYFSSPILHSPNDHGEGDQTHDEIRRQIPNHASPPNTAAIPSGTYSHVSYVRVYANCRLRRIWFGEGGPSQKVPWEFELYSDE